MRLTAVTPEFVAAIAESTMPQSLVELFNTHPTVGLFYITSDGQAFFAENMADAHSQKLKVRDVLELHRDELEDFEEETFDTPNLDQEAADKAAAEKEAADKAAAEKEAADKAAAEKEAADKAALANKTTKGGNQ